MGRGETVEEGGKEEELWADIGVVGVLVLMAPLPAEVVHCSSCWPVGHS